MRDIKDVTWMRLDERNGELESNSQIYGLINCVVDREHRKKRDVRRKDELKL